MNSKKLIARATVVIATFTLLSKILGFIREMALAYVFGATASTDAFLVAHTIPNIIFAILAGALTLVAVPVFSSYAARDRRDEAWQVFGIFTTVISLLLIVIILLGLPLSRYLVWLVAPGLEPQTAGLAAELLVIMLPGVLFFSLANLFYGLLNANNIFSIPALGPIFTNIVLIISIAAGIRYGIYSVALGTLIGYLVAMVIQIPFLYKVGFRFRFSLDIRNTGVKHTFNMMGPLMIGTGVSQIYLIIDRILASGLMEGSISSLNYASKLMLLPQGVIVMAVGTAIFPTLANRVASGYIDQYSSALTRALGLVLLIAFPCGVGLAVLRDPVVRLLFARGAFDETAVVMTAFALLCFSLGLIGQCLIPVVTRGFYALQDTITPVKISIAAVLLNLVCSLILIGPLKHGGLALANSIAATANIMILLWVLVKKVPGLNFTALGMSATKLGIASLIMAIVVATMDNVLAILLIENELNLVIRVFVDIVAGAGIYLAMCRLLKVDEYLYLKDLLLDRINSLRHTKHSSEL